MRGNGDGTFQPAREIDVGSSTEAIIVGDFNRDGFKISVSRATAHAFTSTRLQLLLTIPALFVDICEPAMLHRGRLARRT
jgi:hypothetical protein